MQAVLEWLERNDLSVLIREGSSIFGFPTILFLHTLGLAMAAGSSIAVDLWILQRARVTMPISVDGLNKTMWVGFAINTVSGIALLLAYPAKALTNGVFYLKMGLVVLAVYIAARIHRGLLPTDGTRVAAGVPPQARQWAWASLFCWMAAIVTGRLLAYTYKVLFAYQLS